jgi:hypothetical protein
MANKVKLMKLLQEIRGFAEISQRRAQQKAPGLVLLQLRSQFNQAGIRRRILRIPIQMQELPDIPKLVKIQHIKEQSSASAAPAAETVAVI